MDTPRYTYEGLVAEFELLKKNKKANPPKTEEQKIEYRKKYKALHELVNYKTKTRKGPYKKKAE